ncbi:PREDICTED: trihelix transcription factor GT-3b-like isoform X2 [Ipomoea nil]|uniref:trihelix transcription factor GT-3b-like isoform X2 n=1 Tax=Ipomoea nil TaxID=35883 RepID=UPI0009008AC6|nr:PREDICTED: trihelix transcription factor GT-3b-like isoform X2 [Ipomoea nil]
MPPTPLTPTPNAVWNVEETKYMVGLRIGIDPVFLDPNVPNILLWGTISNNMKNVNNYERTPEECKEKWKSIISDYMDGVGIPTGLDEFSDFVATRIHSIQDKDEGGPSNKRSLFSDGEDRASEFDLAKKRRIAEDPETNSGRIANILEELVKNSKEHIQLEKERLQLEKERLVLEKQWREQQEQKSAGQDAVVTAALKLIQERTRHE